MLKKVTDFLLTKENLIIFILFLLFQPARTQTANLLYIISDFLFLNGDLGEVYSYDYRGSLLGCEEALLMKAKEVRYTWLQHHALFIVMQLFYLTAIVLLLRKKKRNGFAFWLLVVIVCFPILQALIYAQTILLYGSDIPWNLLLNLGIPTLIYVLIGFYIFFWMFSSKQRLQVAFVAFPAFVLSSMIWYRFLGPQILPVVA